MTVSALELDRGLAHGRIPLGDGTYAFQMGHAARISEAFEDGDKLELSQTVNQDFTTDKLLRVNVDLLAPAVATTGATWIFSVLFGATTYYERRIPADGRELEITRIGIPLVAEPQTLLFRLELEIV